MKIRKLKKYLKDYGFYGTATAIHDRIFRKAPEAVSFEKWQDWNRISSRSYMKMAREELPYEPLIAVSARAMGEDRAAFIQSLTVQTYRKFKPLKECPDADYILFSGPGCTLTPDMLTQCVRYLNSHQGETIDLIYFDSDVIDEAGHKGNPAFRPEFDPDLLERVNYIGNVFLVRTSIARKVGLPEAGFSRGPGRADVYHAFLKRLSDNLCVKPGAERTGPVRHIPRILYHEVWENIGKLSRDRKPKREKTEDEKISIIIPNKDHPEDLERCIRSLWEVNSYRNIEILLVENNSSDPEIFSLYRKLEAESAGDNSGKKGALRLLHYEGPFNYSRINNYAAGFASGKYLLFLNNDTVVLKPSSLWHMADLLEREDVGAVGALLMYPDHTVQHGGVILGYGGIAGHAFQGEALGNMGLGDYPELLFENTRNVSAVTAACMMVRAEVFREAGMFDETLVVTFNDVDFCLRLRERQLRILMCPDAELIHYESITRGAENTSQKVARFHGEIAHFMARWQKRLEEGDPFYNENLTLTGRNFTCKDQNREVRPPYLRYVDMDL